MSLIDFDTLFRRYARDLTRFLRRRVPYPDIAADIAQEAFLKVMQARPEKPIEDNRAYLFRTAANLAANWNRHERALPTEADPEAVLLRVADQAPLADRTLDARADLERLIGALGSLPVRRREVFRLYAVSQLDAPEIAERLGISRNMVERHLRKALAHCLERMPGYEDRLR